MSGEPIPSHETSATGNGEARHTSPHNHVFLGERHSQNERRVWLVIVLTTAMMVVEISAGTIYGSMALVADGWHMSTHAGAMLIAALAYFLARRHAHDGRFTFGAGKFGDLAGFASAILLGLIALLIAWESFWRLMQPIAISYGQAILVAVIGLIVNLASAWLLRGEHVAHGRHGHHHHEPHDGGGRSGRGHSDNNLRAAYLHVLADALTSVLAIVALSLGSVLGWDFADPLIGIVGALVIARWSWGLVRDTGSVLLDALPDDEDLPSEIRSAIEGSDGRITDLHVWQVGPGHHAAIIAIETSTLHGPEHYKALLSDIRDLSHLTVEVTCTARAEATIHASPSA